MTTDKTCQATAAQQKKWDERYRNSTQPGNTCWVLDNHLHLLPSQGRSLDVACGLAANALCLAEQGLESHGWDISSVALEKATYFAAQRGLSINTLQRDIEENPPQQNSFDVIVVSQFLYRPLFPALIDALKPNGLLFYQTFNQQKLTSSGPNNPDYLLATNELLHLLSPLELVFYREDARNGALDKGLRDCSYFIGKRIL